MSTMETEQDARTEVVEIPDFRALLEQEIQSCQLPQVNPSHATTDEIIRDMHKVLAGNGDFTRGMLYKLAATRAQLQVSSAEMRVTARKVDVQVRRCDSIHSALDKQLGTVDEQATRKVWSFLWQNKMPLVFALLLAGQVILGVKMSVAANRAMSVAERDEQVLTKITTVLKQAVETPKSPAPVPASTPNAP